MPRKSRRRNRRNRRVSSTKRIRGTRRVSRVRRFRVSRGGNFFNNLQDTATSALGDVRNKAKTVLGNGLTTPAQGLVGSLKDTATDVLNKFTTQAQDRVSQATNAVSNAVSSAPA
jgi:hypothetical protein